MCPPTPQLLKRTAFTWLCSLPIPLESFFIITFHRYHGGPGRITRDNKHQKAFRNESATQIEGIRIISCSTIHLDKSSRWVLSKPYGSLGLVFPLHYVTKFPIAVHATSAPKPAASQPAAPLRRHRARSREQENESPVHAVRNTGTGDPHR